MRLAIFRRFAPSPVNSHSNRQQSFLLFPTLYSGHALLNRGRHLETSIWRSRVWRLQAGFVPPSQEARSPSVPDEGAAFNGWTRSDEGRRKCLLDQVWVCPSCPLEEARRLRQKSPQVERREARVLSRTEHAAPLKGARPRRCAKRRSPPSLEGEGNEGGAPRLTDTRGQRITPAWERVRRTCRCERETGAIPYRRRRF